MMLNEASSGTGGHAAHFANIDQGSPMFSQERAPTSVAYAENQSMFLDSFIDDAAWKGRYALSRYATYLNLRLCMAVQTHPALIACLQSRSKCVMTFSLQLHRLITYQSVNDMHSSKVLEDVTVTHRQQQQQTM